MLEYGINHDKLSFYNSDLIVSLDLQQPMQSVPITTNVVSVNPVQARCTQYTTFCQKVCQ
jgi:hypothetical protein